MTTLLDFDDFGSVSRWTYAKDGFVIRDAFGDPFGLSQSFKLKTATPVPPEPNGDYIWAIVPQLFRADGGRFGLTQIDLSAYPGWAHLTGFKADGSVVRFDAAIDGHFQTIVLPPTFTDLVSLELRGNRGGDYLDYAQNPFISPFFDNLVLTRPNAIYGSTAGDALTGTTGSDDLFGYGGADTLNGGDGDDWLDGGQGDDLMIGGTGDDIYFVNTRSDRVVEAASGGNDTVRSGITWVLRDNIENLELIYTGNADGFGNALNNRMVGNWGANVLRGLGGDDRLFGGDGNDTLEGGSGADVLAGGTGLDVLSGGAGADLFLFLRADMGGPLATITDFHHSEGDKLGIGGMGVSQFIGAGWFNGTEIDNVPGQFRYEAIAGGVRVEGAIIGDGLPDWSFVVLGVTSLQASDFVF